MKDMIDFIATVGCFLAYYLIGAAAMITAAVAVLWMIEGARHVLP
jgi:hypothetical protein